MAVLGGLSGHGAWETHADCHLNDAEMPQKCRVLYREIWWTTEFFDMLDCLLWQDAEQYDNPPYERMFQYLYGCVALGLELISGNDALELSEVDRRKLNALRIESKRQRFAYLEAERIRRAARAARR